MAVNLKTIFFKKKERNFGLVKKLSNNLRLRVLLPVGQSPRGLRRVCVCVIRIFFFGCLSVRCYRSDLWTGLAITIGPPGRPKSFRSIFFSASIWFLWPETKICFACFAQKEHNGGGSHRQYWPLHTHTLTHTHTHTKVHKRWHSNYFQVT